MVYEIPFKSCKKTYVGETARIFKTRLGEHKNEAKKFDGRKFTRSKASIPSDYTFESAVAEHSVLENHVIVIVTYKLICSISRNKLDKHDVTFCCHVSQVMFTWLVQVLWVQRGQRGQPLSPLHSEILNVKIKM